MVSQSEVAQFIERVGGIGDEFAEKDLRVGVERMNNQLEQRLTSVWNCGFDITL